MFTSLPAVPADPLLGLIEQFRQESNPQKIDLGVGIYKTETGVTPVLASVKAAERCLLAEQDSKAYLGPQGNQAFTQHLAELTLGKPLYDRLRPRIAALQTPGGCGALRVAAELIMRARPGAKLWVSDPTWANHVPLLGDAGIAIDTYPYYDHDNAGVRFDAMLDGLSKAQAGDLVLLHGCCHNPSGADLSQQQWQTLVSLIENKGLIPFVDLAYQGFGEGLEEDAYGLRLVLDTCEEALFAVSCSKNFGLYRDRVGMVGVLSASEASTKAVQGNLTQIVRGIYSMPPDHGASVVATILGDTGLRAQWVAELNTMRARIQAMRSHLASAMREQGSARFDFIAGQSGMFSFLGITADEVAQMASEYGIYMAPSSRINLAGLNEENMPYFSRALAAIAN